MRACERVSRAIDFVNERVGKTFAWLLIPIMLITITEVVSRYVFNRPTLWAWDINSQLAAAIALFVAGYALLHDAHVKVDVLAVRLSSRKRAILDLVTSALFFLCIGALIWRGGVEGIRSFGNQERVASMFAPPLYPLKMAVPVAAFLLLIQGVAKFIRDLVIVLSEEGKS